MKALMIAALMALGLQASAQTGNSTDNSRRLPSHRVYRPQTGPEQGMSPEQRAEKQSRRMGKHLGLDASQQRAVYAANLEADRKMGPIRDRMRDAKMDARRIRHDRDQALRGTLTAEQYQKMMEFRSRRHSARLEKHRRGGRMMDRRGRMRRDGNDDQRS